MLLHWLKNANCIFDYKRKMSESPKNFSFPKVLTHAFGHKTPNFSIFGFGQNKTRKNG